MDMRNDRYIKPFSQSTINFIGGNLNLILPEKGIITLILHDNENTKLSINGKGEIVIKHLQEQQKSIFINNNVSINGNLKINVPDYVESIEINSLSFQSKSQLSIKNENLQQNIKLTIHNVTSYENSNGELSDLTVLDSINIFDSATLNIDNVDCEKAKISINIFYDGNESSLYYPYLKGKFSNPPQLISINKNKSSKNSNPVGNNDYQLISGQFGENKCNEWLQKIEYSNSGFNTKECLDNNELLSYSENKKIVIKMAVNSKKSKLTTAAIIGIVVGCVAAVAIIIIVVVIVVYKKKKAGISNESSP